MTSSKGNRQQLCSQESEGLKEEYKVDLLLICDVEK